MHVSPTMAEKLEKAAEQRNARNREWNEANPEGKYQTHTDWTAQELLVLAITEHCEQYDDTTLLEAVTNGDEAQASAIVERMESGAVTRII